MGGLIGRGEDDDVRTIYVERGLCFLVTYNMTSKPLMARQKAVNPLIPTTTRAVQQAFDGIGGRDLRCRRMGGVIVEEVKAAAVS